MSKTLKKTHLTQLSKLSARAEGNIEVLSELRAFMKEKAKLDEEYGKGLEKLARGMALKKFKRGPALVSAKSGSLFRLETIGKSKDKERSGTPSGSASQLNQASDEPEYSTEDGPVRAIYTTYMALMTEAERIGKARSSASERIVNEISEMLKIYTKERQQTIRKNTMFCSQYLAELHTTVEDLEKAKSAYDRIAKETDSAKRKYEETAKKPNSGLNALKNAVSRMDAEERVELLRQKWKTCDRRLVEARNEYLLAIQSANEQQSLYCDHHIASWMQKFDNDFHATSQNLFSSYTDLELSVSQAIDAAVKHVRMTAEKIDPKTDTESFVLENAVLFVNEKPFVFEPCAGDKEYGIVVDETSKVMLGQKLFHLNTQLLEIQGNLEKKKADQVHTKNISSTLATSVHFNASLASVDQLLDIENSIDLMLCVQARLSAQAELLKKANISPVKTTDQTIAPRGIQEIPLSQNYIAVYDYDAKDEGELTVIEGESLVAIEPISDGWVKVRSESSGASGLVPFNYLKEKLNEVSGTIKSDTSTASVAPNLASLSQKQRRVRAQFSYTATCDGELSFKTNDILIVTSTSTGSDAWWEGFVFGHAEVVGQFPVDYVKDIGDTDGNDGVVPETGAELPQLFRARALYDYAAREEGELNFHVGDVIEIADATDSDWWVGRLGGAEGLLPAVYVEKM
ncbi:Intersectin 1 (SH3 domain protein) [Entophlyctis sp. JEL0112]|nr:Intersectin 1 (SH3 domain protein) [Entophlyctis sp. JEL0112]